MAQNLLAALALAGILQRAPGARGLRVTHRFLAHAEGTAGRYRTLGLTGDESDVLTAALSTWDDYRQDPRAGAQLLRDMLADRDQLGAIRPVFPAIESFMAAA